MLHHKELERGGYKACTIHAITNTLDTLTKKITLAPYSLVSDFNHSWHHVMSTVASQLHYRLAVYILCNKL